MSICSCCWDTTQTYSCSRGHDSCKDCLETGIRISVNENRKFGCISSNCNGTYSETVLQNVITDPKVLSRYNINSFINVLEDMKLDNLHSCPFCENRIIIENDVIEIGTFYCMNGCKRYSCMKCNQNAHRGACNQTKENDENERATQDFLIICCNIPFFRGDACNKVSCLQCKTTYCWICKQKNINYTHFGNEKCSLYGERPEPQPEPQNEFVRPTVSQLRLPRRRYSVQCIGTTNTGKNCKRMTKSGSGRCANHIIN
jgi:TRIAD3 protein (E3 ubiquitin-protein ligase RNF216)